jgi:glycerate kinase
MSFEGKVVGGVVGLASALGVRAIAIAGQVFDDAAERVEAISLVDRFGEDRARGDTLSCIEEVAYDVLSGYEA